MIRRPFLAVVWVILSLAPVMGCTLLQGPGHPPVPPSPHDTPAVLLKVDSPLTSPTPAAGGTFTPPATRTPPPPRSPTASATFSPTASPVPTATATPPLARLAVSVDPPRIAQGHTGVVYVSSTLPITLTGLLEDRRLTFVLHKRSQAGEPLLTYSTLFGMPPLAQPGPRAIALTAVDRLGRTVGASARFEVAPGAYETETLTLSPDLAALRDPKLLEAEREKLRPIFSAFTPEQLWDGLFARPITTTISSDFGTRRSYNGGPVSGYHEGNDFRGPAGLPVRAAAAGRVVLAEKLTVRGNALIVDHGLGVFTGYWHLSKFEVRRGDRVKRGQVIARVGNTGFSTAAHLHWEMRVGNVYVDALEWTHREFPGTRD